MYTYIYSHSHTGRASEVAARAKSTILRDGWHLPRTLKQMIMMIDSVLNSIEFHELFTSSRIVMVSLSTLSS